ncbi:MAG: hypothetical protein HYS04_03215 [Acidobacteria bacterium]|nr:hypothetical protein [Acidobacteriota bacterium]
MKASAYDARVDLALFRTLRRLDQLAPGPDSSTPAEDTPEPLPEPATAIDSINCQPQPESVERTHSQNRTPDQPAGRRAPAVRIRSARPSNMARSSATAVTPSGGFIRSERELDRLACEQQQRNPLDKIPYRCDRKSGLKDAATAAKLGSWRYSG